MLLVASSSALFGIRSVLSSPTLAFLFLLSDRFLIVLSVYAATRLGYTEIGFLRSRSGAVPALLFVTGFLFSLPFQLSPV
jgi:hypothetical protein